MTIEFYYKTRTGYKACHDPGVLLQKLYWVQMTGCCLGYLPGVVHGGERGEVDVPQGSVNGHTVHCCHRPPASHERQLMSTSIGRFYGHRQLSNGLTVHCCYCPPASHERQLVSMCSLSMGRRCNSQRQRLSVCSPSMGRHCYSTVRSGSTCGQDCASNIVV